MPDSKQLFYRILLRYRVRAAKSLGLSGQLSGLLLLYGVDAYERYRSASCAIPVGRILDVGAGGRSIFSLTGKKCVSLDLRKAPGLDVQASAARLPFRSDSFEYVVSIDALEHISRTYRDLAISEMKRVARAAVVIHVPVEDGAQYAGRRYDIAFSKWYKRAKRMKEMNLEEHITNVEPSRQELESHGFAINGTVNAELWFSCMRFAFGIRWPIGMVLGHMYYFFKSERSTKPPFWGALGIYNKQRPTVYSQIV